ncbi:MAG: hypothetical protein BWK80_18960 [Desulfobacteraceae bacterium IS3]|nr:MAG: hypothetical protein BWK80_18960 [Desulfobacteraceae bacterium IS3]
MKKTVAVILFSVLFFLETASFVCLGGMLGDVDGDSSIGLTEALHALQITADIKSSIPVSYVITWKGNWKSGEMYEKYDAVQFEGASYICILAHLSEASDTPADTKLWNVMAMKGQKGDPGEPAFDMNGNDAYYMDGNVGIGLASPDHKLDVNGNINANGVYSISGKTVLASDGDNICLGVGAGEKNTGSGNSFLGYYAGYSNLGDTQKGLGILNTFVGYNAGYKNTDGSKNIFLGHSAGYQNTVGNSNTFVGYYAGRQNTQGSGNVFIGYYAGQNETGSDKLYIENSDSDSPLVYGDFSNNILAVGGSLGVNTKTPGSYKLYVSGNAYTIGTWQASDIRWKKNISPIDHALDKIMKLRGVRYKWKTDEYPEKNFPETPQIGLIAQETEPVIPELVNTDTDGYKAVSYEKLTPLLVEAIKEQQAQIKELQAEIQKLKTERLKD